MLFLAMKVPSMNFYLAALGLITVKLVIQLDSFYHTIKDLL